ncbi:MAG: pyridoxamine 5'-phosphate oxidase family protein [Thermoleophilaceae bacterium]|nr:pyridoxamine 5'-phosphate oxidase family protein [Thermoleophilaceae bacterium]
MTGGRRLACIAAVARNGTPHVVPVGMWSYEPEHDPIDVGGRDLARAEKYRDVERSGRAALGVDDLASTDSRRPRGIEVRGPADAIKEPAALIRIRPERIASWGIASDAIGARHSRAVGGKEGGEGR